VSVRGSHRRARLLRLTLGAALYAALGTGLGGGLLGCGGGGSPIPARGSKPLPAGGVVHVVKPGETVWRISHRYGVSVDSVIRANGVRDVSEIPVGTQLYIPDPADPQGARPVAGGAGRAPRTDMASIDRAVRDLGLEFAWPVRGSLNSDFGRRGRSPHEGIDIDGRKGSAVLASEAGRVIFADRLGDYGHVVIVKHVGDWSTVYAHNRRNKVRKGQFVEKGDLVAELGDSGNASGPHLHFEIRQGRTPIDPLRYLP
jgi:murein DD-endopeptidase MepM/ murein hydrolase activator NlpD